MRHFMSLKLPFFLLGIGAALLLTPACKAQSEISPDHFDGTDSWVAAGQKVHSAAQKRVAKASLQAKSQKTAQGSAFQLAAAREVSKPVSREAAVADRKRNMAAHDREKE